MNPERAKAAKASFLAILAVLGYARKNFVGTKLESQLTLGCRALNKCLGSEFLNSNVEVKWVSTVNKESFIKNGKVIVRLSYKDNPNRNFVNAVVTYVGQGLLPNAKHFISPEIVKSSELVIARKFIEQQCEPALGCFMDEVYKPLTDKEPELKETVEKLHILDKNGFFMQILLPELHEFGSQIYPSGFPSEYLFTETKALLEFLVSIATKEPGVDVPLEYNNDLFSFNIMIVAKKQKIESRGIQPYLTYIKHALKGGFRKIYIIALGIRRNNAKDIIKAIAPMPEVMLIEQKDTEIVEYNNGLVRKKGVCYVVTTTSQQAEDISA